MSVRLFMVEKEGEGMEVLTPITRSQYSTTEKVTIDVSKIKDAKIDRVIMLKRELRRGLEKMHLMDWDIDWDLLDQNYILKTLLEGEQ